MSLLTGGLEILFELQSLERRDACVIVTQYPEIEICGTFYPVAKAPKAIETCYEIALLDCVEYAESGDQWRVALKHYFEQL